MGDFNSNDDPYNNNNNNNNINVLYNPYVVDLYESINNNNNGTICNSNNNNCDNEFSIPLTQSLQNLLPPATTHNNNNNNNITSIDINLNQLVYSTPSQQITTSAQPIYQAVSPVTVNNSPIIDYTNTINNNNNLLGNIYQDPTIQLQIQQLQQQLLLQQHQQQQQQILPINVQVQTINHQHQSLLVPQQQTFYGNASTVSDNSSPEINFSFNTPSSPNTISTTSSPLYEQPATPASPSTIISSTNIPAPSVTSTGSKSSSNKKDKEKEKDKEREIEDEDRPKKKKKFDKNVFIGVDLGDDLLDITSEEFQAYKNNFFANTNDKKTQSALNYQFRKIKNRESARRSRERKATHVEELEAKIAEIEKERDDFKKENQQLRSELDQYRLLDKQKSASSIFDYVSIGSPATQNFSKNFGIILFLFLFGSFILTNTNPTFFNTQNNNNNNNNNVNSNIQYGVQHSNNMNAANNRFNQQQYFSSGRNPLSNLEVDDTLESLSASQGVFNTHFVPQEPTILLNRESIRNWATLQQNSVASLSFEKDSALNVIEKANIDKSKHNVISSVKQLQQQDELMLDKDEHQEQKENCNNNNDSNNNSNCINDDSNNNNESNGNNQVEEIIRKPATYSPGTRYVNNSTISLVVEPRTVIGDDDLKKGSNITTFGTNSLYKFNFLIDSQNFPNGSNDISKAFLESDNQQMTVTSVIISIEKSPKQSNTNTQQPNTQ